MESPDPGSAFDKPPVPEDWAGEPRFVVFFVPSPSPVALPDGATFAFERDEIVEWLKGTPVAPVEGVAPRPGSDDGHNHVSIRVWRLPEKLALATEPIYRALTVAGQVVPDVARLPGQKDLPLNDVESECTVFETVTPLLPTGADVKASTSDAFDRCLEAVSELTRAYMISSKDIRTTIPSENRLFPILPFTSRTPDGGEWGGLGFFMVNKGGAHLPSPTGVLNKNEVNGVMTTLSRMKRGDPTTTFAQWSRNAARSFWFDGDYAATIISAHTSTEVLLDAVLLMMAWEEGKTPAEVAAWFDAHLAKRVRTYYHDRLGGSWDTGDPKSPVGGWSDSVRMMRNRVVHRGYWPSREEANSALDGAGALENYVKDRLATVRTKLPRVTLMILGIPGLSRRGLYSGKIKKFAEEIADTEPDWFVEFGKWVEDFEKERASR